MFVRLLKSTLDYSYAIVIEEVIGDGPQHSISAVSRGYLRNMEYRVEGDTVFVKSDIDYNDNLATNGFDYRLFRDNRMKSLGSRSAVADYISSWGVGFTGDQKLLTTIIWYKEGSLSGLPFPSYAKQSICLFIISLFRLDQYIAVICTSASPRDTYYLDDKYYTEEDRQSYWGD